MGTPKLTVRSSLHAAAAAVARAQPTCAAHLRPPLPSTPPPTTSQPTNGWLAAAQKPAPPPPPPQPPKLPVSGALYGRPSLSQPASLGRAVGRWWREGEKGRGTQSTGVTVVGRHADGRARCDAIVVVASTPSSRRVLWARLLPRSLAYPDSESPNLMMGRSDALRNGRGSHGRGRMVRHSFRMSVFFCLSSLSCQLPSCLLPFH